MTFELAVGPQLSVRTTVEKGSAVTSAGNNPSQFFRVWAQDGCSVHQEDLVNMERMSTTQVRAHTHCWPWVIQELSTSLACGLDLVSGISVGIDGPGYKSKLSTSIIDRKNKFNLYHCSQYYNHGSEELCRKEC